MTVNADTAASASHRHAFEHLCGPFIDGARERTVALDAAGFAAMAGPLRHPLLLLACKTALGAQGLAVSVVVTAAAPGALPSTSTVSFAAHTEAGASLPVFASDAGAADAAVHSGFSAQVTLLAPAPAEPVSAQVELRLVEGLLGRTIYLLGAEKQRIRQQARQVVAARSIASATANALDRIGADLGVPRLQERLEWSVAADEPTSRSEREADAAYRNRLALFRPFLAPSPRRVQRAFDGDDEHASLLAPLGFTGQVTAAESNADLAVAVKLVGSGPAGEAERLRFLDFVRCVYLVKPGASLPTWSLLPGLETAAVNQMLARLALAFQFALDAYIARPLGEALDLLGRVRAALGVAARWPVLRTQDDAGGSRYELGLAVEVAHPVAAELDLMVSNLLARQFTGSPDFRLQVLIDSLQPLAAADDPQGRWLLSACGLRTLHATGAGLLLSHLPFHGMQIDEIAGPARSLAARLAAPGDVGPDAHLFHALAGSLADAAAAGVASVAVLSAADAQNALALALVNATPAFERCGLRTPADAGDLARALSALAEVPAEAMATLQLDAAMSAGIVANDDAAVARLNTLVNSLRRNEMVSVLPLVTSAAAVLLVVATSELPGAAVMLNARVPGFRWYVLPVRRKSGGLESARGARNRYFAPPLTAKGSGLDAIVTVAMVRRDREDPRGCIAPYEIKLDMPADQRLNLPQFELLMNLLHRIVPLGVVVDTRSLREQNVDPVGDGSATPFTGLRSHAWRAFAQRRYVGFVDPES